jgi:hypothetical protein
MSPQLRPVCCSVVSGAHPALPSKQQQDKIQPKLADFYASLSDDQKAKFNAMGPAPHNASGRSADKKGDM